MLQNRGGSLEESMPATCRFPPVWSSHYAQASRGAISTSETPGRLLAALNQSSRSLTHHFRSEAFRVRWTQDESIYVAGIPRGRGEVAEPNATAYRCRGSFLLGGWAEPQGAPWSYVRDPVRTGPLCRGCPCGQGRPIHEMLGSWKDKPVVHYWTCEQRR